MRRFSIVLLLLAATLMHAGERVLTPMEQAELLKRAAAAAPAVVLHNACSNGDFEFGLDPDEWEGADGMVGSSGIPAFTNFGIASGSLFLETSHQTPVDVLMVDPIVGIPQVAPGGSTRAVRIGNAFNNYGAEKLTKTFVVTSANAVVRFWYAAVLEDPGHPASQQPAFSVQVLDAFQKVIPGLVNLGNPVDPGKLVADRTNPFFDTFDLGLNRIVVVRPWTCAYIDLTGQIGKTVTVEFITIDCTQGAHYGYAYLDNFCGTCGDDPAGDIRPGTPPVTVTLCDRLCFDYTLPQAGDVTGSVVIRLEIVRGGVMHTATSPLLTAGDRYCFDLTTIPGLPLATGAFEYRAIGLFSLDGRALAPKSTDLTHWVNACDPPPTGCCTGPDLIVNGDFEAGGAGFTSAFTPAPSTTAGVQLLPGRYAVVNSADAAAIANWNIRSHGACDTSGKFLAVNGETGRTGSRMIWSQTMGVAAGKEYRFCANLRNLPQCALDVKPAVEIRFSTPGGGSSPATISASSSNACDWIRETRTVTIPTGVNFLTTEIWLDETSLGDGNDIALDDLSLQQMQPAEAKYLLLNIASSNLTTSTYNVTASPLNGQPFNYSWEVCEVDGGGNCIPGTRVVDPAEWRTPGAIDFRGYNGTASLTPGSSASGVFEIPRRYRITYSVSGLCTSRTASTWYVSFNVGSGKVAVQSEIRP